MNRLEYNVAEFASRWKQAFSPESVAAGKNLARNTAINKDSIKKGIYPMQQGYKDLEHGINSSTKLATKGKQAMLTKAASPNRTMKPTTLRGNLKVAPSGSSLSPKSAQAFKQGVDNKITNNANAVTAKLQNQANKVTKQGNYKVPLDAPTLNPFEQSSWEKNASKGLKIKPIDVSGKLGTLSPANKPGLLSKIGGAIKRNPVAAGAGIGAVGAGIGYGIYRKMKSNNNRQK